MTGALATAGTAGTVVRIMFRTVVAPLCAAGTVPTPALCTIMLGPRTDPGGLVLLRACTASNMSRDISGEMISRILL
ncbi:hypothetical protein NP493_226g05029 [Ridgeia piscesae]|uniref:Uncharacterized protein n=1 Tax=Ridgeia piscesae TaxID=27915 RepID=A0AAD9P041_RIDPI|nr:hypothetical protein NP493_226g05029 [Ridgeia piscesae]